MNTEERVKSLIIEQLGIDPEKVDRKSSFTDDLGADSLDCVELWLAFEQEFCICIPEEDAERLSTVGDAIDYIKKSMEEKKC